MSCRFEERGFLRERRVGVAVFLCLSLSGAPRECAFVAVAVCAAAGCAMS